MPLGQRVVDLIHHPLFYEKSFERTAEGELSAGLKNALGVSPLDCVRISGAFLTGAVDAMSSAPPAQMPPVLVGKFRCNFLSVK